MIEWIVSSSVLIVLLLAIRCIFRKKLEMRVRYALWLIVAVRLLVPFSLAESNISVLNLLKVQDEVLQSGTQIIYSETVLTGQENLENYNMPQENGGLVEEKQNQENIVAGGNGINEKNISEKNISENGQDVHIQNPIPVNESKDIGEILTSIWVIGVVFSVMLLMGANWAYCRKVRTSGKKQECWDSKLPVYLSDKVNTPCMFGIFRPAIYLTRQAVTDEKALKYILCHENTHYRHRDNWWAIVRALCVCLHWYNPLVWLAAHVSKQDCELACDEETIMLLDASEKVDYGRVLLNFSISGGTFYDGLQLATTMSGGKKQLKERLQMIVSQPKRYISALAIVTLLVVLLFVVTFTGRAEESETGENGSLEQEVAGEVERDGSLDNELSEIGNSEKEETDATEEIPYVSIMGYDAYTGYLDECLTWTDYQMFVNQDYDEDGLIDRVWRENIEDWALCSYRIDFGNGDVLLMEKTGGGSPSVQTGDLDGDGQNEILLLQSYGYSTDPTAFGEWAVYKKSENSYEMLQLPGDMADYEGNGNGGVLPAYHPMLSLEIEKAGQFEARILSVEATGQTGGADSRQNNAVLDVVVPFSEEEWKLNCLDSYVNQIEEYSCNIYKAELEEGTNPCLKLYASMFGKWCVDEVVTTLIYENGKLRMQNMEYQHHYTTHVTVDLNDGNEYSLEIGGENKLGSNAYQIKWMYLYQIEDNAGIGVQSIDLTEATEQEWGSAQEIWAYEANGNIIVEDLNFDGYEDFALQGWMANRNIPYYCWLWNPVTKQYEYSCVIANVEVDREKQLIISAVGNGGGEYGVYYYKYDEQNNLHMTPYVEENFSSDALFENLDLSYCELDYSLPTVNDYEAEIYGGALNSKIIYWAKQALNELYRWSGYKVEKAYFTVYESGDICFAQTEEDMRRGRIYFSRTYSELDGEYSVIPSMNVATEREVWYSPVIQWNVPENHDTMPEKEIVLWYFEKAALAAGETVETIEENFEDNYIIKAESGNYYEITYNGDKRLVSSIYGPYPDYPTH